MAWVGSVMSAYTLWRSGTSGGRTINYDPVCGFTHPVFGKKLVCLIEHVLQPRLLAWGESTHNALPFPCVKPKFGCQ
jgi:hypothetical protein